MASGRLATVAKFDGTREVVAVVRPSLHLSSPAPNLRHYYSNSDAGDDVDVCGGGGGDDVVSGGRENGQKIARKPTETVGKRR